MPQRTSLTDPLRIAELAIPGAPGAIGITFCPGKKDRDAGWDRDLEIDLDAIVAWGAVAVVTLIRDDEFALLDVEALPRSLDRRGIAWFHLPILDVSTPDDAFEGRWPIESAKLRAYLEAGKRIIVHCRGGLGRAGTVAALLLVDFGVAPDDAIARVRAVRPGAIETARQAAYVHAHAKRDRT